jgi:protein-S-isoprenylcysteine O-methyltransferase Ste14
MGRLTIYAQNNPRQFGLRTALGVGVFSVFFASLLFGPLLVAEGFGGLLPVIAAGTLVGALVVAALGGLVGTWMMRRMVKGRPLPVDADPAKVWAANWQIIRGTLHPDPETNRLGRILADQSDMSRSPKFMLVFGCVLVVPNLANALLQYANGTPFALVNLFLAGALVVMIATFVPLSVRRQRMVRQFRETYDLAAAGSSGTLGRED